MKKKTLIGVATLLVVSSCIYGYVYTKNKPHFNNITYRSESASSKTDMQDNLNNKDISETSYGVTVDTNTIDITNSINNLQGKIKFLNTVDKDNMLIATDSSQLNSNSKNVRISVLNLISGKIERSTDIKLDCSFYNMYHLNNGFYITTTTMNKDKGSLIYYIYDNNLNLIRTIDLSSLYKEFHSTFSLSNKGDRLSFISNNDAKGPIIYTCDLDLKNMQKVCQLEAFKPNKLTSFDDIRFESNDQRIDFIGKVYIDQINDGIDAFGSVNLNGTDLKYKEHDGINVIEIANGKTLFSDAQTERGKHSSGQVYLIDSNSNDINEYTLKDKDESQYSYISNDGNYIVTRLTGRLENNTPIYRFRIYDTKSKTLVKQFDITFQGKNPDKLSLSGISIVEERKSIYVAYNMDGENKLYRYKLD